MDARRKIKRARDRCQREGLGDNPDLMYLVLDELRSANFRLAMLIGTNGVLVALVLAVLGVALGRG